MSRVRLGWALLGALALLGTLALSLDGLHYWHDVRFLFATTRFSLSDLLQGQFNPHQSWGPMDLEGSAGFYAAKVLHLSLLKALFAAVPPEPGGLKLAVGLSVLAMLSAAAGGGILIRRMTGDPRLGWLGTVSILLMPVTPYLAGKLLAEVTSLALVAWALAVLWPALGGEGRRSPTIATLLAGALLSAAALCRLDSLFGAAAFLLAAISLAEGAQARARAVKLAGAVSAIVTLLYVPALALLGVSLGDLFSYLAELVGAPAKPLLMSVLAVASFGGVLYPIAALAALSRRRNLARFFLLWWALAWLPSVALTSAFMVEPRYLIQGLLPLAGLVVLGLEALFLRLHPSRLLPVAGAALLVILAANLLTIQLMPYELDRPALLRAVDEIERRSPGAAILVPWAYTDFNFLYVMRSAAPVYNVHSPRGLEAPDSIVEAWQERYRGWYGTRYLAGPAELQPVLDRGPVYYLGWHRYPPLEFAERTADRLRLAALAERLRSIPLIDHLETSWLSASPNLRLELEGRMGQYEYYRIEEMDSLEPAEQGGAVPGRGGPSS